MHADPVESRLGLNPRKAVLYEHSVKHSFTRRRLSLMFVCIRFIFIFIKKMHSVIHICS
jgi:hypothetical protein